MPTRERKQEYFQRMTVMLDSYAKILIVHCDHVGSQQLHMIRSALRGKAEILMGKNTLMRKVVNTFVKEREGHVVEALLPCLKGNIGLIFTNADFADIRKVVEQHRVPAVAKAGQIAECDVIVPPGPTGCDPGQTSWFQALNVPTKISKGQIEIVSELKLISKGNKVMLSEAALLQKLNIKPFSYGLILKLVYESGSVFTADVLDITQAVLETKFITAMTRLTCIGLSLGIPSVLTVPHSVARGVKRLIALSAAVGYSFEEMKEWDSLLNMDPAELAKLQASAGTSAGGAGGAKGAAAAAADEKKPEEEKVEEVVLGGGDLFGDSKDGY